MMWRERVSQNLVQILTRAIGLMVGPKQKKLLIPTRFLFANTNFQNSNPPSERMPRSGTLQNIKGLSPSAALRITRAESRIFSRQDLEFDADEEDMMVSPLSSRDNFKSVATVPEALDPLDQRS